MIAKQELRTALDAVAVRLCRHKGAVLFRRGDAVSGLFLVCQGEVRLGLDGAEAAFPVRVAGPGSLVGLPATMSGEPSSLTAVVTQDAELGFVPRQAFLDLLRQNVNLSLQVIGMLSEEIYGLRATFRQLESDFAAREAAFDAKGKSALQPIEASVPAGS